MSSSESSLIAIQCTHCGAPLKLLGGGRVTTVTCEYCNSLLDMSDEYKVLVQFQDKYRPKVPFSLGMQGVIKEIEWTIIGWIVYSAGSENWSEFFLYSPLYGYAWLIYEEGELSFSKRVRDFTLREWEDKQKPKALFYQKGHYLAKEDPYFATITFVQGELTFVAKANDRIRCWDYFGVKRKSLSIEKMESEIEVYLNEKLDAKIIYKSFGVKEEDQIKSKQTLVDKVFEEESLDASEKSFSLFNKWMFTLAGILFVAIILSFFIDNTLIKESSNQPFSKEFTITSPSFISKIELKAPSPKILNAYRLSLYQSHQKVFSIDKNSILPHNKKFQYSWKRGDDEVVIYIKLAKGEYRLQLEHIGTLSFQSSQKVTVTIQERVMRLFYILPLFLIMALMLFFTSNINHIISSEYKELFWWGVAGIVAFLLFGFEIVAVIIFLYFFVRHIQDNIKEELLDE